MLLYSISSNTQFLLDHAKDARSAVAIINKMIVLAEMLKVREVDNGGRCC